MTASATQPDRLRRLLAYLEHDEGNLRLRKDAIREALDAQAWDVAGQLIEAGLWLHPEEAELLAFSGLIHLHAQHYIEAEQALSDALEKGVADARYYLALVIFMQRQYSRALELLAEPLPQPIPLALTLRARCLHHLARADEAIADCRASLQLNPEDADANGVLALLLQEQERYEQARVHADAALRVNPSQLEALLALANVQRECKEYSAAQRSFDVLLQAHPDCGRGWLGRALIKITHLQFDAALQDAERAATHLSAHIGTWHVLAWIHLMRGEVAAAQVAFERAMQLDRNFGETHGGFAVIEALQGREEEARASIKRALRLDPKTMSAVYAQMLLAERQGKPEEARGILEAFVARPVAGSDMQFRDLVKLHMAYLQAQMSEPAVPPVLH